MKLAIFLIGVVLLGMVSSESETRNPIGKLKNLFNRHKNVKRRFGGSDSPQALQCVTECGQDRFRLESAISSPNVQNPIKELIPEKVNEICRDLPQVKTCVAACAESSVRTLATTLMEKMTFICEQTTLKTTLPCLKQAWTTTSQSNCITDTCAKQAQALEETNPQNLDTQAMMKTTMKQICKRLECETACDKDVVISQCGQAAQNDIENFNSKTIEVIKSFAQFMELPEDTVPSQCEALIN